MANETSETTERDWQGRPVPADESPETVIKVWEITPHLSDKYDGLMVRGWQEMLDQLRVIAEHRLEDAEDDDLSEGLTFTVRLTETTRGQYDGLIE